MKKFILSLLLITMSTELYGAEAQPSEKPSQSSTVTNFSADSDGENDIDFLDAEEDPKINDQPRLNTLYTKIKDNSENIDEVLNIIFSHYRYIETNRYKNQYETLLTRMFADTKLLLSEKFFKQVIQEVLRLQNGAFLAEIKTAQRAHRAKREAAELTQKKATEISVWNEILKREEINLRFMNETLETSYPEKVTDLTSFVIKYPAVSSIAASTGFGLLLAGAKHYEDERAFFNVLYPALSMTALWGTSSTVIQPSFPAFMPHQYHSTVPPFLLTPFKLLPLIGAMAIGDYLVKTTPTIPSVALGLTAAISTWILDAPLRKLLDFENHREKRELSLKSYREKQAEKIKRINAKIARLKDTRYTPQAYTETDDDFLDLTKYYLNKGLYDLAADTLLKINPAALEKSMEDISNDIYLLPPDNLTNQSNHKNYGLFFKALYEKANESTKEIVKLYSFFYDTIYILLHSNKQNFINFLFNNYDLCNDIERLNRINLDQEERLFVIEKLFNHVSRSTIYKVILLNPEFDYMGKIETAALEKNESTIVDFIDTERKKAFFGYRLKRGISDVSRSIATSVKNRVTGFFRHKKESDTGNN